MKNNRWHYWTFDYGFVIQNFQKKHCSWKLASASDRDTITLEPNDTDRQSKMCSIPVSFLSVVCENRAELQTALDRYAHIDEVSVVIGLHVIDPDSVFHSVGPNPTASGVSHVVPSQTKKERAREICNWPKPSSLVFTCLICFLDLILFVLLALLTINIVRHQTGIFFFCETPGYWIKWMRSIMLHFAIFIFFAMAVKHWMLKW